MALTTAQKLDICKIIGITPLSLDDHLDIFPVSADVETKVEAELTRWETAGVNFVKVHPNEKNFGAEINPNNEKADIRRNIGLLLGFDLTALNTGGIRLVRG